MANPVSCTGRKHALLFSARLPSKPRFTDIQLTRPTIQIGAAKDAARMNRVVDFYSKLPRGMNRSRSLPHIRTWN
jgi:hypothetical protein